MSDSFTDGNRLGGPLGEVLGTDLTDAVGRCAGCGLTGPLAAAHVFDHAPGLVARCLGCGQALLRLVRAPGRAWLDVRGLAYLEVAVPAEA